MHLVSVNGDFMNTLTVAATVDRGRRWICTWTNDDFCQSPCCWQNC